MVLAPFAQVVVGRDGPVDAASDVSGLQGGKIPVHAPGEFLLVSRHGLMGVAQLEAEFGPRVEADGVGPDEGLEAVAVVVGTGEEHQEVLVHVAVDEAEGFVAVCRGGKGEVFVCDVVFDGVGGDVETEDGGVAAREVFLD